MGRRLQCAINKFATSMFDDIKAKSGFCQVIFFCPSKDPLSISLARVPVFQGTGCFPYHMTSFLIMGTLLRGATSFGLGYGIPSLAGGRKMCGSPV